MGFTSKQPNVDTDSEGSDKPTKEELNVVNALVLSASNTAENSGNTSNVKTQQQQNPNSRGESCETTERRKLQK